jgi:hypothetical protein
MHIQNKLGMTVLSSLLAGGLLLGAVSGTAFAGRGGSAQAIQSAIAADSVDTIQAELERAEHLVCAACSDMVVPLIDHPNYRVRQAAAWWLARRGVSHQVYVAMLNRLAQPDSVLARNAADIIGEFRAASAIPALSAALTNPIFTGEARAAMAHALGQIGRNDVAAPLTLALGDADPVVKAASLQALRGIDGFHDGMVAVPLVSDADANVRGEAATTIGMMHTQGAASALVAALTSDPDALVRKRAAWSLGAIGAPVSVAGPALQTAATSDANPFVRSLAQVAISKLTR